MPSGSNGKEPYPSFQHVRLNRYHWYADSTRAEQELGYHARPLAACLTDTYRWFQSRGLVSLRGFNRWWMWPESAIAAA